MIDEKKCAKCRRTLPVEEYDWMDTDDGRQRRKATCMRCLGNQREKAAWSSVDHRTYKHELEEVFRSWKATAFSASETATPATLCSSEA